MGNYAQSVALRFEDDIAALFTRELQVVFGEGVNVEGYCASLQRSVKIGRHEAELVSTTAGQPSVYRCAGYKLTILPAHVEMSLNMYSESSAIATERICAAVESTKIGCPPINYSGGQLYLPCDNAGSCVELARLACELEQFDPRFKTLPACGGSERPRLVWDNGRLLMDHPHSLKGLFCLNNLREKIVADLRPGMYEYAKNGGTR